MRSIEEPMLQNNFFAFLWGVIFLKSFSYSSESKHSKTLKPTSYEKEHPFFRNGTFCGSAGTFSRKMGIAKSYFEKCLYASK
jgi:hypothetical protein